MLIPLLPYSNQYVADRRPYDLFNKIEHLDLHETPLLWQNNAFNLVAKMESGSPLMMTFRVHKNLYRTWGSSGLMPVLIKATFNENGGSTVIDLKIKSNIVYSILVAILTTAFIIGIFRGKFLWQFLICVAAICLLEYLEKYDLLKKFESLMESIGNSKPDAANKDFFQL